MTESQNPPDAPIVDEDAVERREREKLDIGDDHPESRDIGPHDRKQGDELDVGDPHPAGRDTAKS
jgi:hypothetical protein